MFQVQASEDGVLLIPDFVGNNLFQSLGRHPPPVSFIKLAIPEGSLKPQRGTMNRHMLVI